MGGKKEREDFEHSFEALISNYLFAEWQTRSERKYKNSSWDCSISVTCISCYHWNHYDLLTNRSLSALSKSNHETWASNPLMWLPVFIEGIYCYRLWWGFDMPWCATQEMLKVWNILKLRIQILLINIKFPTKIELFALCFQIVLGLQI